MHTKEIADPAATTVEQFKQDISGLVSLSPENIRLVCEGRVLENVYPLSHYNLADNATIHCLEYRQQAAPSAAAQVIPTGNAQDEMMAQMMNNPMVEAMMSSPEMMQMMLQMNPQLQQLCEQNPEIRRILEDPETLQQSMRAMRNPQLMREMMRNADRGMAQLNTIPGGEDALRRLHTEMIDPLNDAMSGGQPGQAGGPGNQQGSDRYAQDEIPTAPLANPFDQSRNSPPTTGAAGGPARASAATSVPGGGGGVMGMGPNPFASMGGMGGMGMPGANPFANLGAMGMPAAGSTAPPAGPPMGSPLFGGFGGVAPPPGGLFGGGSQQQPGAGNIDFLSQMLAGLQTSTPPASNMAATTSSTAAAASRDAGADEFKLELRYGSQAPIFHICKKTTSVKDLKGEVEPLVNFRRVYVRLIREGKVWENEKTVEDYLGGPAAGGATSSSAPATTEGSDHAAPPAATSATEGGPQPGAAGAPKSFVVYVTKNVENGQREVPLLPTAAASPSASASPATPAVNPFLAAFGGGAPAPAAFGGAAAGPGGAGAALPLAGMGGGNDALMQMLLGGGGGLGGGLGGGGGNALGGGGFGAMPMLGGNPREVYSTQLGQLRAMGFEDEDQCVRVLQEVNGDVSRALDRLFGA